MRRQILCALFISAVLLTSRNACAQLAPPNLGTAMPSKPLPLPYRPEADATAEIDAALSRAKISSKRVLIDFGANWCTDCRILAGVVAMPQVRPFIDNHFEVVLVDVGRFSHNMDLWARFGAGHPRGIPAVLVVTPAGKLVNGDKTEDLSDDRSMTPQAIVDWLAQQAAPR